MTRSEKKAIAAACLASVIPILLLLATVGASSPYDNRLWPMPSSLSTGSTLITADGSSFKFQATCTNSTVLQDALDRYLPMVFWYTPKGEPTGPGEYDVADAATAALTGLSVCVKSANQSVAYGVDETYTLDIPSTGGSATLTAATFVGALRGLETFSQLVEYMPSMDAFVVTNTPVSISDEPRFAWRGMLLDSARHYLPVSAILRQIDALAYNKFNTLHWHIVDAESFPFVSTAYPDLSAKGAYFPTATYTADQIDSVVTYAASRGIRVVVEFDGPGHAFGMALGYPEIGTNCGSELNANLNNIPLSPASNLTLPILAAVYGEAAAVFPDEFFHLGGDEVVPQCWGNDPKVVAWMNENNVDEMGVYQYFVTKQEALAASLGKTPVHWEDVLDNGLNLAANAVIEVWRDGAAMMSSITAGFRTIAAYPYYLDKQMPNGYETYEWTNTWITFYTSDPYDGLSGLSKKQLELVIGGEACMWGEDVDAANIDTRIWPRAAAVGERLWSPQSVNNYTEATLRLANQDCRMQRRGYGAGPVGPGFCILPEYLPQPGC